MPGTIATYPPGLFYEVAFNAAPNQVAVPPWFTDVSARTTPGEQGVGRGRQYELDVNQAGTWTTALQNKDGALDPTNAASPFAPGVVPYRPCRIRAMVGANLLTADQSTAGDASGYSGAVPVQFNVGNDFGFPVSIVASGTAFQGGRVYQAVVPSGQGANTTVLIATAIPVVPGVAYSFSAQTRIPSGTSTATQVAVLWFDNAGNSLTPVAGASAIPTSGSSSWTALSASGVAPSNAYSASLKVQIASGSTAASTTWQIDALQWERSSAATPYQVPQTLAANLLPRDVATATASLPSGTAASSVFYSAAGTLAQATGLTATPTGQTTALAWTTPSGTTNATPLYAGTVATGAPAADGAVADCVQVTAGQQYTASMYVSRLSSADATVQVMAGIRWLNASGLVAATNGTATTVTVGSWTRITVTAFAPTGALWGRPRFFISTPASTTATNTIYSASWQFEQASSASAWLDPGATLDAFAGTVERWPQTWTMSGTYGLVSPTSVDALAALAQYTLLDPFIEDVLALGPNFCFALNDSAGSTTCADISGGRPPAPIESTPIVGAGSLTLGNSITSASPGLAFLGTTGPVATFANNPAGASNPVRIGETFVSIHKTTTTPGPPANGNWTRLVHFRCATAPAAGQNAYSLWEALPPTFQAANISAFNIAIEPGGTVHFAIGSTSALVAFDGAANLCDGNWHQVAVTCDGAGNVTCYIDGTALTSPPSFGSNPIPLPMTGIASDTLGASTQLGAGYFRAGVVGDEALAVEFPAVLTAAQITGLYTSWRFADAGESSGARAARVLDWINWTGPSSIDTGQTTAMGPASDLTGATALDALNAVALTENGNFYAAKTGTVTFTSRTRRYNQLTPTYVFGENAALGEWPYEDYSGDYDPQHLFNIIQVTQYATGQVLTAQDPTSILNNYPRLLQRTINPAASTEAQDAANYLLQQYKSARLRISNLVLNPSAIPGLFEVCLRLEIGTRIRVMRRPPGAPAVQFDGFIESIQWTVSPDSGAVQVILECSPADLAAYWLLGATHTTLNAQATSGTNTATINALPDAAVNALASSLPQGYQLTFEPGTVRQETMTLTATGIPATSPGWQTATLTFTANFAFTHPANSTVCEPLPTGATDPATWDAVSTLGASSCQVVSGGASGTNTITLGPLGDAKTNSLGSDWNTGDLIWISPGTAAFEGYNLLTPNQATAGESVFPLAAGTNGSLVGVGSALGTASVTASGSAFQGSNVWQVPIGASASLFRLLRVMLVPATAGLAHTWSAYVRSATTGANPTLHAQIIFLDATGNGTLATVNGTGATLTGGPSAAWTRVSVTATAPAGTVFAALGIPLDATAPSSAWTFQGDALQWEVNGSASPFCVTPQIKSVAASVAGYSSVQITLNTNLLNNHAAGDFACDPLPPGDTNPAQAAGTARIAY